MMTLMMKLFAKVTLVQPINDNVGDKKSTVLICNQSCDDNVGDSNIGDGYSVGIISLWGHVALMVLMIS